MFSDMPRPIPSGEFTEIDLWSNSDSTQQFTYGNISLSENFNNFKYIGFEYQQSTTPNSDKSIAIFKPEYIYESALGEPQVMICANGTATGTYGRLINKVDNTTLYISVAYRLSVNETDNQVAIPLRVIGYK